LLFLFFIFYFFGLAVVDVLFIEATQERMEQVQQLWFNGVIQPYIDQVYSIQDIQAAHVRCETGFYLCI